MLNLKPNHILFLRTTIIYPIPVDEDEEQAKQCHLYRTSYPESIAKLRKQSSSVTVFGSYKS